MQFLTEFQGLAQQCQCTEPAMLGCTLHWKFQGRQGEQLSAPFSMQKFTMCLHQHLGSQMSHLLCKALCCCTGWLLRLLLTGISGQGDLLREPVNMQRMPIYTIGGNACANFRTLILECCCPLMLDRVHARIMIKADEALLNNFISTVSNKVSIVLYRHASTFNLQWSVSL